MFDVQDKLMSTYGLTLDEAIMITDEQAARLLKSAEFRVFDEVEFNASFIAIKVGELFSGKKAKYEKPKSVKAPEKPKPLTEGAISRLEQLAKGIVS